MERVFDFFDTHVEASGVRKQGVYPKTGKPYKAKRSGMSSQRFPEEVAAMSPDGKLDIPSF